MESLFIEGLILQGSLIFALGAQNIFVLESGMKKEHPLVVSFVCFLCDLILIMLGVAGAASFFSAHSQLKILIGIIGVICLIHYGLVKIFTTGVQSPIKTEGFVGTGIKRAILLSITFSIFNPHAYLDAFILIGGYSSKYAELNQRIAVGLGAAAFSGIWFLLLSSASSFMKPHLDNPRKLRMVMSVAGVALLFLSFSLGRDVYGWVQEEQMPINLKALVYGVPSSTIFTSIIY